LPTLSKRLFERDRALADRRVHRQHRRRSAEASASAC